MLLREDGVTRPSSLDEVERRFGDDALADVMSMSAHWHDLIPEPAMFHCRCWSQPRGEWVAIVLPGVGKIQVSIDKATSDANVLAIFNRVLEADMLARRNVWKRDGSGKAFVDLTEQDLNLVQASSMKLVTRQVRHINIAAFTPPDRPAA
jgi:hypothetical protein